MPKAKDNNKSKAGNFSRRDFIRFTAAAVAVGPFFAFPDRVLASQKKLKIAHWAHFVPAYDQWFDIYASDWGKQHDTRVTVDHVPRNQVNLSATAEVRAGKGHDLFVFPPPPATFHEHVIDHGEVYQMVASRHGAISRLAHLSTFNPQTKKHFAFTDSWIPAPLHYYEDFWATGANMPLGPPTWDSLRSGAKRVRASSGAPCGLAFGPGLDGNVTLQSILWGSRVFVQDDQGTVRLNAILAARAMQYAKDIFQESGTPDQFSWGPSGNEQAMLARKTSCTISPISLVRAAEEHDPELAKKIMINPPLLGMARIIGPPYATNCWAIWNFAENQEDAKQFTADFVDNFSTAYDKSQGCNFPMYQNTVPNLIVRLMKDAKADPPYKYEALKDALYWTRNLGFPGFSTPPAMEVFDSDLFPRVFAKVIRGEQSPEDGAEAALYEINRIFARWKQVR